MKVFQKGGELRGLERPDVELHGFEVDHVEKRDVGEHRRNDGSAHDVQIGQPQELGHDEGRRPHDGGHELAVRAGADLHRRGLVGRQAHLLHEGDGEGPGGRHVGDGGARHQARQSRGHHRRLGRPPPEPPQRGEGYLHEVLRRARLSQQRAEENEEENKIRRYPDRHAPDAAVAQKHVVHHEIKGNARVGQEAGHPGADEAVEKEDPGQDRKGGPQRPTRRLQKQKDEDGADHHVPVEGDARSLDDPQVVPSHVRRPASGHDRQNIVVPGDRLAHIAHLRRDERKYLDCPVYPSGHPGLLLRREGQVNHGDGEGEVDAPCDD